MTEIVFSHFLVLVQDDEVLDMDCASSDRLVLMATKG